MKTLLFALTATTAFAASDPASPVMLSGPWVPEDSHQIDFAAQPRVVSEHVVINDVRSVKGVNQHNYLAHHDGQFWAMWSDGRASRIAWASG